MQDSYALHGVLSAERLASQVKKIRAARNGANKHAYFRGVANARYVLRKVFRIVEEQAKTEGLDPLAHQALLQIYGSPGQELRVKELAERLDIAPAFASSLTRTLTEKGLVERFAVDGDQRATMLRVTEAAMAVLTRIDAAVKLHVDYFNHQLSEEDREMTIYIMMFYVGVDLGA
ncbi:MAG: MarR family winged helix-turn-helix transcriptional regulator [Burkholderiaceae bacterium]